MLVDEQQITTEQRFTAIAVCWSVLAGRHSLHWWWMVVGQSTWKRSIRIVGVDGWERGVRTLAVGVQWSVVSHVV